MTLARPKSIMRGALTLILTAGFLIALAALMKVPVPPDNRDMVFYMLGQLSGGFMLGIGFYLASSKSSEDKNDIVARALERPSGNPGDPVHVEDDETRFPREIGR